MADKDAADMAVHVYPYVESERTVFYEYHPELSRPMGAPAPMARAIFFHLKPGQDRVFSSAVAKIHAALEEQQDWSPYEWYSVEDGGKQPTWVVVLPRENWAGFEPSGDLGEVMSAKYGEEAPAIWASLFGAVAGQYSHTMAFPAELSYSPMSE